MSIARVTSLLFPALMLLPPGTAVGQSIPSPYRYIENGQGATAFAGILGADRGRFNLGPESGPVFGVRYSIQVSNPLALEGVLTSFPTTRDIINPAIAEGDRSVGEADVNLTVVDVRLRMQLTGRRTWHSMNPYVVVGGGLAFDVAGDDSRELEMPPTDRFEFGTEIVGVFGVGNRFFLDEHLVLRTDAYLTLYQLEIPSGFTAPDRGFENVPENEWVSGKTLTVGLSWLF